MGIAETIEVGSVLGEFKIEKILGKGGMGVVYKAHEPSLNRKVALKVLSEKLSGDEEFISRFKKEAQIIAALNHPHIVSILSFGKDLGHYYFAMEYIQGTDLGQVLKERTVIPQDEALIITRQIAGALSEAGARGVVHRDLKPANIMIDDMNRVRVTDFGVARLEESTDNLTKTGMFLGTPEYASPEQASGGKIDTRSDIYALGALLYRMLSGKPPTTGDSAMAVVVKIATEPVTPIDLVNPSVPKPVADFIGKMMAKDLNERFQTPEEVLAALDDCEDKIKNSSGKSAVVADKIDNDKKEIPEKRQSSGLVWGLCALAGVLLLLGFFAKGKFFSEEQDAKVASTQKAPAEMDAVSSEMAVEEAERLNTAATKSSTTTTVGSSVLNQEGVIVASSMPAGQPMSAALPESPRVLLMLSGAADMTMLLRSHLESAILDSGLEVISPAEIPILREKMQLGRMPIDWYDIKQLVPKDNAQVLVLAKIQKSSSTTLKYYGRSREQVTASFSVRTLEMPTGKALARTITGLVRYTDLNMEEMFQDKVGGAVSNLGATIGEYWLEKLGAEQKVVDPEGPRSF